MLTSRMMVEGAFGHERRLSDVRHSHICIVLTQERGLSSRINLGNRGRGLSVHTYRMVYFYHNIYTKVYRVDRVWHGLTGAIRLMHIFPPP